MVQTTRRRTNSSCRGLLEVTSSSIDKSNVDSFGSVQYTHKTVRDYIRRPEVRKKIRDATKNFDGQIKLCSAYLAAFKTVLPGHRHDPRLPSYNAIQLNEESERLEARRNFASSCLKAASGAKPENKQTMIELLDALHDTSIQQLDNDESERAEFYRSLVCLTGHCYPSNKPGVYNNRANPWYFEDGMFGSSFLALVVRFGVVEFVKEKITYGCLERRVAQDSTKEFRTTMISRLKNAFHGTSESANPSVKHPHLYWPLLMDALFAAPASAINVEW
ncbi:hypothetical protein CSAL01_13607 [Colletotrichum salicis]|uniref:DUF7791 domain-containing protein n=1 Tax=Colletotrichum salicis TaxID=1209931 RepID=A0A135V6Z6_9PEZI|nr:hypothetical protein CSAL01_13607 [Colletotrichum salicis]